ncbi:MAG: hydrogenase/urease maturation nickel metallochaperone HypA [bacterium]
MHDLHLADKILKQILEFAVKNKLSRIEKVWIEIGPIVEHGAEIEPENLVFNLAMLGKGTLAERAEFDVKKISQVGEYIIKEIEGE